MKSRKIVLHFSKKIWDQPVVCHLSKDFDLTFNILKAQVTPNEEGLLVLELTGSDGEDKKGIRYLREQGVKIQRLPRRLPHRCPGRRQGKLGGRFRPPEVHRLRALPSRLPPEGDGDRVLVKAGNAVPPAAGA